MFIPQARIVINITTSYLDELDVHQLPHNNINTEPLFQAILDQLNPVGLTSNDTLIISSDIMDLINNAIAAQNKIAQPALPLLQHPSPITLGEILYRVHGAELQHEPRRPQSITLAVPKRGGGHLTDPEDLKLLLRAYDPGLRERRLAQVTDHLRYTGRFALLPSAT